MQKPLKRAIEPSIPNGAGHSHDIATQSDPLVIGRVSGFFGLEGGLKVFSYTEPKAGIARYSHWLLECGGWRSFDLLEVREHGHGLVARLAGVAGRDAAAELIGVRIGVGAEQLLSLPQGEYYWFQLIGAEVVNTGGETLGVVQRLIETGANDVLVVDGRGSSCLIPYVRDVVVRHVDLAAGRIEVDWQKAWCDAD